MRTTTYSVDLCLLYGLFCDDIANYLYTGLVTYLLTYIFNETRS